MNQKNRLNAANPPFNNVKLRQAVAWALPYEQIMQASLFGRGVPMWGAKGEPTTAWPQPFPYTTDPARAKAMGAAGRERVLSEFGWAAIAQQTVGVYNAVLAARG